MYHAGIDFVKKNARFIKKYFNLAHARFGVLPTELLGAPVGAVSDARFGQRLIARILENRYDAGDR